MTVFCLVMDILLVGLAVALRFGGRFGATRQCSLAPAVTAGLDLAFLPQIDPALTPGLSALLIALQAVILLGGAVLLYEDRAHARQKQARRERRREVARCRAAFELRQQQAAAHSDRRCA